MVDFRNAMRNVARDKNVEWYDLYGDMPKIGRLAMLWGGGKTRIIRMMLVPNKS